MKIEGYCSRVVGAGVGVVLCGALMSLGLSGCGGNFANLPTVDTEAAGDVVTTPIGTLSGHVYGGQQPIWQGHVYLMKASKSGYGTTSTSLLQSASNTTADTTVLGTPGNPVYYVTTDSGGNFNITGDYTCSYNATTPADSDQLYLVGLSGNTTFTPGTTPTGGSTNPYIGEMAVLGQCPSNGTFAGHLSYIYVNEVSTVAAAYALAGFATNSHSVGSGSSTQAQLGLANAFANANQLYDIQGSGILGQARTVTPNGNGTVPNQLINSIADMLASCINQSNSTTTPPTTGNCKTLYSNTGNSSDTASAAIYIAQHPGSNVPALFGLVGSSPQFATDLPSQPSDFAAGIKYTGSPSLTNPVDVAIDAGGDAWVTSSNGYVSKLSPLGVQASGSPFSVSGANYVAIDESGNAWVTSSGGRVYELNSSGASQSCAGCSNSDIVNPGGVAIDGSGNAYTANIGGGAVLLGLLGTTGDIGKISSSGTTYNYYYDSVLGSVLNQIPDISQAAVDSAGYVWGSGDGLNCTLLLLCSGENVIRVQGSSLTTATSFPVEAGSFGCLIVCSVSESPEGIAIDSANNGWVAVAGSTDELKKITTGGVVSTYTGGGLGTPQGVAADGSGDVWVANSKSSASSVSEFTSAGAALSGTSGYGSAVLSAPTNLDIDPSGDVWVVSPGSSGYVTEFIGIATPVVRPISAGVAGSTLATKP